MSERNCRRGNVGDNCPGGGELGVRECGWAKCRNTEYFSHKYNNHLFASKVLLHYNRQKGIEHELELNL